MEAGRPGILHLRLGARAARATLRQRLEAAAGDGRTRCAILEAAPGNPRLEREPAWLITLPLPVLFAFDGRVGPGQAPLALAADIRVCGPAASLYLPARPGPWARARLEQLRAPRSLLGSSLAPPGLLAAGLVSTVAPGGAASEALRLAGAIAERGPIATALAKEAIWRGLSLPLEQALRFETDLTLLLQTTKDRAEGVRAFLEKRPPRFTGY